MRGSQQQWLINGVGMPKFNKKLEKKHKGKRKYDEGTEQRHHQELKKEARKAKRDIIMPPIPRQIIDKREELELDIFAWLSFFLPGLFSGDWTPMRRNLIEAILYVGEYGGYRCRAGYRGCGKTSITEGVTMYLIFTGKLKYVGVVAANGPYAQQILTNIKGYSEGDCGPLDEEKNELNRFLTYYPEIILPIVSLEGISGVKAISQTVNGERTHIKWSGDKLILPTVKYCIEGEEGTYNSKASGAIIHARGVDAPLRGMKHGNKRPDLIIGDDWDEEGESDQKTKKKMVKVRGEVAGLGGKKKLAIVMLCNTPKRMSIGFQFSNPMIEPAWSGERYPFVIKWPEDEEVLSWCRDYVSKRKEEQTEIALSSDPDRLPRKTDQFFLDNKDWVCESFKFADNNKFYGEDGIDGKPIEYHPVQHFWNRVADTSEDQAAAEMNMNPAESENEGLEGSDMDSQWFQSRYDDALPQTEAQEDAIFRNDVYDCGKYYIHWIVSTWSKDATSRIVSYGVEPTGVTREMDDLGAEFLFLETLSRLYDSLSSDEVYTAQGRVVPLKNIGIDAGYLTSIVYKFKREKSDSRVQPLMGTSDLRTPKELRRFSTNKNIKLVGNHFQIRTHNSGGISCPLMLIKSDYYKSFSRSRWRTSIGNGETKIIGGNVSGSRRLYKPDGSEYGDHRKIGEHLASSVWVEEKNRYEDGKQNHWSDTDYYDCALAYKSGIRLPLKKMVKSKNQSTLSKAVTQKKKKKRLTLSEKMAK